MEDLLCDELIQEIIHRIPPSSTSTISLVSKRWLHLHRTSKTSISIRLPSPPYSPSLSTFLSLYPHISSLTLITTQTTTPSSSSDHLLLSISSNCSKLIHLRFFAGPVSPSSLISLSSSCKHLTSLTISTAKPLSFHWVSFFPSLKHLSFTKSNDFKPFNQFEQFDQFESEFDQIDEMGLSELPLESLCLAGIGAGDSGVGWLWKNCTKLRKLGLKSCEGLGDGSSFNFFVKCLKGIHELELRTCRTIVDGVLLQLGEHNTTLQSLLLYDGGSQDGLLQFVSRGKSSLRNLDLRLPLDLNNNHLSALAENFRGLVSFRLQSCCLLTGEGLKTLSSALRDGLEELALINCDAVEREPGLLITLGQNLKGLRKLDLSYNELLLDKEFVSMLISCTNLVDIKLRGCRRLTGVALLAMLKSCQGLESVDVMQCCGIGVEAVEVFLVKSPKLRRVHVEESKLSDGAKTWLSQKFIEVYG